jgi:hypothetical protein
MPIGPPQAYYGYLEMIKHPTITTMPFDDLNEMYGACSFQDTLADYIARINYPGASGLALRKKAEDTLIPFHGVPIFHRIKFKANNNHNKSNSEVVDSMHAQPEKPNLHGKITPLRFDTILVYNRQSSAHGKKGMSGHINV